MRFAVTLYLRDLIQRLPTHAVDSVGLGKAAIGCRVAIREHDAIAEIAVVRNSQHATAGLGLVSLHPLPEIFRVITFDDCEGQYLTCEVGPITI